MSKLTLDSADKVKMTDQLKAYLEQEFDLSVGAFEAEFLLDFITDNFAATFYNKGLADAQQVMQEKIETFNDAIYELEMSY
ncbi:DUF2164 domain-containing protein [Marinomonas arenicola]|uniref:DUF2164 domain-containing protein n=1 Tax=Marinomonas arenicola TaxID=569601 RepID=UPI0031202EAB